MLQLEIPARGNPAIVRCLDAMDRAARETMKKLHVAIPGEPSEPDDPNRKKLGAEETRGVVEDGIKNCRNAYREAMPPLVYEANIRDFIACVAHGILIDVLSLEESSKLLYAAQVAASAETRRYKSKIG
ncbi:MAG TPA: hypothetical protein VHW46_16830 [Terracidiphilus sp.]|nr:hypothetical protein [Terracidiphilus sp.]